MNFSRKVLDNGLKIVTVPDQNSLAATVLVLVEAGSKYETKDINGLSHFLEHMCFKGTRKRPKAIDISSELDALGAQYNAFTGQEYTGYYAKVISEHFDRALDLVSDLYLNPVFREEEIEKEKGVVVEEINMYEDIPQRKVSDLLMELLYGNQPAGWPIAGEREIVKSLTKDALLDYRGKHYVASGTTVIVAGKFDEKTVFKKIEDSFSGIVAGDKHAKIKTSESQINPNVLIHEKKSDQTHLILATRGYDMFHPDRYVLEVMSGVLGGGMSSRLFQKIREDMGAAYYVKSSFDAYTDHGYLDVAVGADHKKVFEVISAVLDEFKRMKKEKVEEKELQIVKDFIIGNMFLGLETSDSIANFYGGQELLEKNILTPQQIADKIKAVSAEDMMRVAQDIFVNAKLNLALIGPFDKKEQFEKILNLS